LFDLARDPDCVTNLASNPDFATHVVALREKLMSELKQLRRIVERQAELLAESRASRSGDGDDVSECHFRAAPPKYDGSDTGR